MAAGGTHDLHHYAHADEAVRAAGGTHDRHHYAHEAVGAAGGRIQWASAGTHHYAHEAVRAAGATHDNCFGVFV